MSILLTNENNTPEENLQILRECIEQCRKNCDCIAMLRQYRKISDSKYNSLDIQTCVLTVDAMITINDGLAYVQIMSGDIAKLMEIRQMHETVRRRGTEQFLTDMDNDYVLLVELQKTEEMLNIGYTFSFFQPQFFTMEQNTLEIAVPLDRMRFFKDQFDRDEIGYALLSEEVQETKAQENSAFLSEYDDAESYVDSGAFISGDSFLN